MDLIQSSLCEETLHKRLNFRTSIISISRYLTGLAARRDWNTAFVAALGSERG